MQEAPLLGGSINPIPEDNYFLHNQRLGLVENVNTDLVDQRFYIIFLIRPLYRGQVRFGIWCYGKTYRTRSDLLLVQYLFHKILATQKNIFLFIGFN